MNKETFSNLNRGKKFRIKNAEPTKKGVFLKLKKDLIGLVDLRGKGTLFIIRNAIQFGGRKTETPVFIEDETEIIAID